MSSSARKRPGSSGQLRNLKPADSFKSGRASTDSAQAHRKSDGGSRTRWSLPSKESGVLSPTRANVRSANVTADPSDIEKLLREVDGSSPSPPPKSRPSRPSVAGAENAVGAPPPTRVVAQPGPLTQALTRSRRSSGAAKASSSTPGRRLTVDALEMEALLQELQAELPSRPSIAGAGRRDTIEEDVLRRLLEEELSSPNKATTPEAQTLRTVLRRRSSTADAEQLLAFLNNSIVEQQEEDQPKPKPKRRSSAAAPKPTRAARNTADPAELEELLREMQGGEEEEEGPTHAEEQAPSSPRRATLDPSELPGMLEDASFQLAVEAQPPKRQAAAPRRDTVDPSELEDLINQSMGVADENAAPPASKPPATRRRSRASSTGARPPLQSLPPAEEEGSPVREQPVHNTRSRTPEQQQRPQQRRTTVSPGAFQDLFDDLSIDMVVSPAPASRKSPRKSPRLQRTDSMTRELGEEEKEEQEQPSASKSGPPASARARLRESAGMSAAKPSAPAPRPPPTPGLFTMSPPPAPSALKSLRSCISSKKKALRASPTSAKKVAFGSPDAAFFSKGSPVTSITPMSKVEMKRCFPHLQEDASLPAPPPEAETGVTAQNTAILAQWDEEDDDEEEEGVGAKSPASLSSSGSSRRSRSKSPRPQRRKSLSLPRGSPGFMVYGVTEDDDDEEEKEEEGGSESEDSLSVNRSFGTTLSDKLALAAEGEGGGQEEDEDLEEEEGEDAPMDVSPIRERRRRTSSIANDNDDEMPDIGGERDPAFRSRDERTSHQLGIIGGRLPSPAACDGPQEATMELEEDLGGLVNSLAPRADMALVRATAEEADLMDLTGGSATLTLTRHQHPGEDRTQELEQDLDALMHQVEGAGGRTHNQQGQRQGKEQTVELEADLQALVGAAMGKGVPANLDVTYGDDSSDEGTVEYDEEDVRQMRLSLGSHNSSAHSPGADEVSVLLESGAPGSAPAFSMSFTGHGSSVTTSPSSASRRTSSSGPAPATTISSSSGGKSSSGRKRRSSTTRRSSTDHTDDSSPFAHIKVGRLRGSSTTGDSDPAGAMTVSSTTLSSTPTHTSGESDAAVAMTVSTLESSKDGELEEGEVREEEEEQGPVGLDWTQVEAALEPSELSVERLMGLAKGEGEEGEGEGPSLRSVTRAALLSNTRQLLEGLASQEEAPVSDMAQLRETVESALAAVEDPAERARLAAMLQGALPQLLQAAEMRWGSMQAQLAQLARAEATKALGERQQRTARLLQAREEVQGLTAKARQALEDVTRAREEETRAVAEAASTRLAEARAGFEAACAHTEALEGEKVELQKRIKEAEDALAAQADKKGQEAAELTPAAEKKRRLEEKLKGIQERVLTLRGLHLVQPKELRGDQIRLVVPHPDGSETEAHVLLDGVQVSEVRMSNTQARQGVRCGPLARRLLQRLIRAPFFCAAGEKAVEGGDSHSWSFAAPGMPARALPEAIARFERLIGRANMLVDAVARVEAAYPCSLVLDEQALLEEGAWVDDFLYGTCPTCPFGHNSLGGDNGCKSSEASLLVPAGSARVPLLPECCGVLEVTLSSGAASKPSRNRPASVTLKLALSVAFLSHIPAKLTPSLQELRLSRDKVLSAALPFLRSSFGQNPPPASAHKAAGAAALLKACEAVEDCLHAPRR